ncbi:hypothetical protein GGR51DRAFT_514465 [Nemania sp. FL0031]|nr:hypothetical protein GGR51DRAFT_514465 [Nemania sp. FL0031]
MDLVSSIRKTGSRGGVNFDWQDVTTSAHRENYLGHSLKAPVGRWQKGKDLTWYAKAEGGDSSSGETAEEKAARERKEELKKIKEAEEDALARALGLPVAPRNVTGANAVDVGQSRTAVQNDSVPEAEGPKLDENHPRAHKQHGDSARRHRRRNLSRSRSRDPERRGHRDRNRDRDGDRNRDRDRHRERSPGRNYETRHHRPREERESRRSPHRRRSYSRERGPQRLGKSHASERDGDRSRSIERSERRRIHRGGHRSTSRGRRRSKSPQRYQRRSP